MGPIKALINTWDLRWFERGFLEDVSFGSIVVKVIGKWWWGWMGCTLEEHENMMQLMAILRYGIDSC